MIPPGRRAITFVCEADRVDEAHDFFAHAFQGSADVRKVSEMIDEGYLVREFLTHSWGAWDLVILPYKTDRSGGMRKTNLSRDIRTSWRVE